MPVATRAALESLAEALHLNPSDIDELTPLLRPMQVEAGTVFVVEGSTGGDCFIVVDGEAEVRRDNTTVATLERGDFIGEFTWLQRLPRSATVVAATEMTLLAADSVGAAALLRRAGVLRYLATRLAHRVRAH